MKVTLRSYKVTFVGEYFTLSTTTEVPVSVDNNEDIEAQVIAFACDLIDYQYGWDVLDAATVDVQIEEVQ